jgi:hypothetical protein
MSAELAVVIYAHFSKYFLIDSFQLDSNDFPRVYHVYPICFNVLSLRKLRMLGKEYKLKSSEPQSMSSDQR